MEAVTGELVLFYRQVRWYLECCTQLWAPQYRTAVGILDQVQQRAVEMIKPLELVVREAEASLEIPESQRVQPLSSLL